MGYILLPLLATLVACGSFHKEANTSDVESAATVSSNSDEIKEVSLPSERAVYRATRNVLTDLIHTKLEVNLQRLQDRNGPRSD